MLIFQMTLTSGQENSRQTLKDFTSKLGVDKITINFLKTDPISIHLNIIGVLSSKDSEISTTSGKVRCDQDMASKSSNTIDHNKTLMQTFTKR